MTTYVVDASVWLAAIDADDVRHDAARTLVEMAAEGSVTLAALDLTLYEVANVAVVAWKSRRDADRVVELVRVACPNTVRHADLDLLGRASALAAKHGLTVYDAAYVATAREQAATLVSGDEADLVSPGFAISPQAAIAAG